jgi:hypothetical protein
MSHWGMVYDTGVVAVDDGKVGWEDEKDGAKGSSLKSELGLFPPSSLSPPVAVDPVITLVGFGVRGIFILVSRRLMSQWKKLFNSY